MKKLSSIFIFFFAAFVFYKRILMISDILKCTLFKFSGYILEEYRLFMIYSWSKIAMALIHRLGEDLLCFD